jgi:hypothetical protein
MNDSEYSAPPTQQTINDWVESLVECGAETLNEIRQEWDREKEIIQLQNRQMTTDLDALLAPLRERLAKIEGQMTVLLGGDNTNSPTRSKRSKQLPDNGHSRLLEHRPQ